MATMTPTTDTGQIGERLLALVRPYRAFNQMVQRDIETLFAHLPTRAETIATEAMIAGLPAPVQRYLRYAGVLGKPLARSVYVEQRGKMRSSAQAAWQPFDARQYISVQPPGFVWDATMRMLRLPAVRIRDRYLDGHGEMLGKLCALVPVVRGAGAEMDQGTMLRYLSEMQWFPSAFLGDNITFAPLDDRSARVTLTNGGRSVTGTMCFDDVGRLTNFVALRYYAVDGEYTLRTWTTPVVEYGEFGGLKLPTRTMVTWKLPEGDLEWLDLTVTNVQRDIPRKESRP